MKFVLVLTLLILTVSAYQPWPSKCACGRIYLPLCASDGKTYNNRCEFECRLKTFDKELKVEKEGRCEGDEFEDYSYNYILFLSLLSFSTSLPQWTGFAEKDCACTSQYDPVCASDLRRYYNICTYECRLDYIRRNNMKMIDSVDCKLLPPSVRT